jgi:hypothetical protein
MSTRTTKKAAKSKQADFVLSQTDGVKPTYIGDKTHIAYSRRLSSEEQLEHLRHLSLRALRMMQIDRSFVGR